MKEKIYVK